MAPNCEKEKNKEGCVSLQDFQQMLDSGCPMPRCFVLGSYEPEKEILEKKMSIPRLQPPQEIKEAPPELDLTPITAPVVSVPAVSIPEVPKAPISEINPLLGALLMATITSLGVPLLKELIKNKLQKKTDDDTPIECKPSQVKTNKKIKALSARIDKLEDKQNLSIDTNSLDDIAKRLEALEKKI